MEMLFNSYEEMTSSWTEIEKRDFIVAEGGQFKIHSDEGRSIIEILQKECGNTIKTIVEIGTWNGLGSTMCILHGIQGKDVRFWSLECNKEKHDAAVETLSELINEHVQLVWGSIVDISGVVSDKYLSIFPTLNESEVLKEWFKVDLENCAASPNVLNHLPEKIDFFLLDGGEFTTLYEFDMLFERCSMYIALDDTLMDKCREVRKRLIENTVWDEIVYLTSRNGFSIFKKRS